MSALCILVDGTYLGMQMKGVGRYVANTLHALCQIDHANHYKILVRAGEPLPNLPQGAQFEYIPIPLRDHYRHGYWVLGDAARREHADRVWVPYETTVGNLPCPYTMVCHDVPQLIDASQAAGGDQPSFAAKLIARSDAVLIQRSLRNAAVVFANSHFVANWLTADLKIPLARVAYAPCAPGADFGALSQNVDTAAVRQRIGAPAGYLLVFATGDRRENIATVCQAFDALVARGHNEHLVLAGIRGNEAAALRKQLAVYAWKDRVHLLPFFGESETATLAEIYTAASVYLDLSLHEGFGMQVIEAMACGAPVVSSNRGALPEVAGEAALLVNPQAVPEIASVLSRVLTDRVLNAQLRAAGRVQASKYSWAETARVILEGLQR